MTQSKSLNILPAVNTETKNTEIGNPEINSESLNSAKQRMLKWKVNHEKKIKLTEIKEISEIIDTVKM